MSVAQSPAGGPSSSELDQIVKRFESAWKAGPRPNVDDFLPPGEAERFAVLVELVHVDLERRLMAGEAARVEEYLQRFPELAEKAAGVVALLKTEYEQRKRREPSLAPDEYWRRFPQYEEQLRSEIGEFPPSVPPRRDAEGIATGPDMVRDPEMPARLGRYRVTAKLGQGGFGVVYKAYDDELRRDVAIKVPHRERIRQPADADIYLAEARVVAALDHPHIVPVHDLGRTDEGLCFVVSKFIEGSNLAEKIAEAPPSWIEAVELVAAIAEALHYAHKRGLVHRDVKPGNILIDRTAKPFLADFGLALQEEDVGRGGVCGTPAYMSPEQANGEGHRVDGRSDIFSLGVVLYELLTGRRPFRGEMPEILGRIIHDEPRPPRQIDDAIPKELERICLKALAKRASDRYTTARDLADDLWHFRESALVEVGAASRAAPGAGPARLAGPTPPTPLRIVPKGLRSFDAGDADFYLELLPGPRDRDGLPESLRFWKTRIEQTDPDNTLAVGLIYGPSASGYAGRAQEFADLLRILDGEVRLITPTDPKAMESEPEASATEHAGGPPVANAPGSERLRCYQLTHDYLVPSLRDWLTRKQKETRRGRAELLLADRAAVWNARPEKRQLPSLLEWWQIRWRTDKKTWTQPQRKMMRKTARVHAVRASLLTVAVVLAALGGREVNGRVQARVLRDRLLVSTTADVPGIVREMGPYRPEQPVATRMCAGDLRPRQPALGKSPRGRGGPVAYPGRPGDSQMGGRLRPGEEMVAAAAGWVSGGRKAQRGRT